MKLGESGWELLALNASQMLADLSSLLGCTKISEWFILLLSLSERANFALAKFDSTERAFLLIKKTKEHIFQQKSRLLISSDKNESQPKI